LKLYHYTDESNIASILSGGLRPNKMGVVYLTPCINKLKGFGNALLEVETGDIKLTCFEDCEDWEVLCWGQIATEHIRVI